MVFLNKILPFELDSIKYIVFPYVVGTIQFIEGLNRTKGRGRKNSSLRNHFM